MSSPESCETTKHKSNMFISHFGGLAWIWLVYCIQQFTITRICSFVIFGGLATNMETKTRCQSPQFGVVNGHAMNRHPIARELLWMIPQFWPT